MKKRLFFALFAVIVLFMVIPTIFQLSQSSSPPGSPAAVSSPAQGSSGSYSAVPSPAPARDLYDLTMRLRPGVDAPIPRVVNSETPVYKQGQKQIFWMTDLVDFKHFQVNTTLRYISQNAYLYVQDGSDINDDEIRRGAEDYEKIVLPSNRKYLGTEAIPGVDNDPRLSIVVAKFPGAAGYYSMSDEYPKVVNPYSNEREAIYLVLPGLRPGSRGFVSTLSHEYAHAIHWNEQPNQETWISEGIAELAARLAGFAPVGITSFQNSPDTQLTAWGDDSDGIHRYYGGAFLFMRYLFQNYGGFESIRDFFAEKEPGALGVTAYLKKKGYSADFDRVFKDWVIANYLDEPGGGRYSYPDDDVRAVAEATIRDSAERTAFVNQYGTDYYDVELPSGDATVKFSGNSSIKLVATNPRSGSFQWWSNRGDSIDSRLTREFDLSGVRTATLKFSTWYDIEESWDYAYVAASTDGGINWETLPGTHTTKEDPIGNSFGHGFTGRSGGSSSPVWVDESVDLSPYAGKKVLLRFEYVTDEGLNKSGIALDDITIPELGFRDDAESESGWTAEGFVRTTNVLEQRFLVQVIKSDGSGNRVELMPLNANQEGQITLSGFGKGLKKATIAISGLTPATTEMAQYRLTVSATR